jgi:hypothetical protein
MDNPQDSSAYRVNKLHKSPICVCLKHLKAAENLCENPATNKQKRGDSN